MRKRLLSILLLCCMVLTLLPTAAFAADDVAIDETNFPDEGFRQYVKDKFRFLYKGIIIKHNKTEPTYTKTSLFLCEKRRFFMARTEKGVVTTI